MDLYAEMARLRRSGEKCALATVVGVSGSAPSFEAAKILVREDGSSLGTVGGGCVEAQVLMAAREVMETGKPRRLTFDLSGDAAQETGLMCGGELEVFVEPVFPQPVAILFGAGHISMSLSKIANLAGFSTVVVDDRASFANRQRYPEAEEVFAEEYESVFPRLNINDSTYIVIATRGHRDDLRVLRLAAGAPARYIAMIGSKRKVIELFRQLEAEGVPAENLGRIHAPMGLDIGALTPEEIAVSVVAEMIAVRRNASSDWRRLSKAIWASRSARAS